MVLAPGRLSTMIRWPICSLSLSATIRESVSLPPPGGNGEMKRSERVGYCCAWAALPINAATSRTAKLDLCMKRLGEYSQSSLMQGNDMTARVIAQALTEGQNFRASDRQGVIPMTNR